MIPIPNKPSPNTVSYHFVAQIIPLVIFFILAVTLYPVLFSFIAFAMIWIIVRLFLFQRDLMRKEAEIRLQIQHIEESRNLILADIQNEELAIQSFNEKIVNYSQLKGLTEKLSLCLTLDDTSTTLSAEVNKLFGDKDTTVILYLFHSKTGELGISASQKGQMRINIKSKKGDIFDRYLVRKMNPLLIEDTKTDYRFDIEQVVIDDNRVIRSLVSVPLIVGTKALGILRVDSPKENHFTTSDMRFLTTIGDLGALAIENAQLYQHVELLAIKDSLTDLYLRRFLLQRMPEEISRQIRREGALSFLMIDLDHFKKYNDTYGHIAGDIVLKTVGKLLAGFFQEPGFLVCRYGGEEFSVLLPDCPKKKAKELAEAIRKKIAEEIIILRRQKTNISISVGVATFPDDAKIKEELIEKADHALYQAKKKGRNRVCVA